MYYCHIFLCFLVSVYNIDTFWKHACIFSCCVFPPYVVVKLQMLLVSVSKITNLLNYECETRPGLDTNTEPILRYFQLQNTDTDLKYQHRCKTVNYSALLMWLFSKKVRGPDSYIPLLTGKREQQWFTVQSGVVTSISSRQCSAISGRPFPKKAKYRLLIIVVQLLMIVVKSKF